MSPESKSLVLSVCRVQSQCIEKKTSLHQIFLKLISKKYTYINVYMCCFIYMEHSTKSMPIPICNTCKINSKFYFLPLFFYWTIFDDTDIAHFTVYWFILKLFIMSVFLYCNSEWVFSIKFENTRTIKMTFMLIER